MQTATENARLKMTDKVTKGNGNWKQTEWKWKTMDKLLSGGGIKMSLNYKCGPMPNVMVALPNTGGALCSTPQSLADAHYLTAVQ